MSNILTDFRVALTAHLETNLQAGKYKGKILAGVLDGEQKRVVGCIFSPPLRPAADVNYVNPTMVVRFWIPKPKMVRKTVPAPDPEPVEQLMIDLATTLRPVTTTLLDSLYFLIPDITPDYDDWGVQATLVGWATNPSGNLPNLTGT